MTIAEQFRALGRRELPEAFMLGGGEYVLDEAYKHSSISAVGLYRAGDGDRVVLKCYREAPWFGVPMRWMGRMMAAYEAGVMRRVHDIRGIPRLRAMYGQTGLVRDFVPGEHLTRHSEVSSEFFEDLLRLLREVHARGIAYVDLEKPGNVIIGPGERPYLMDWQVAFHIPPRWLGHTTAARWLRRVAQKADMYHARKHYRRVMRDRLTPEQIERLRPRPWFVRLSNKILGPWKKARRRVLGK